MPYNYQQLAYLMENTKMSKRVNTGIQLEPDVLAYLEDLKRKTERSRTWLVNAIVREHVRSIRERELQPALLEPAPAVIQS